MREPIGKRKYYWGHRNASTLFAEAIGFAHFLVANLVMFLGQFFHLFDFLGTHNGGIKFIYGYIDLPVYFLFGSFVDSFGTRGVNSYLGAELVILVSSAFYSLICYLVFDVLFSVLDLGK